MSKKQEWDDGWHSINNRINRNKRTQKKIIYRNENSKPFVWLRWIINVFMSFNKNLKEKKIGEIVSISIWFCFSFRFNRIEKVDCVYWELFFFWYSDRSVCSFVNASQVKEKKMKRKKKFKTKDMVMFIKETNLTHILHTDKNHTTQAFEPK